MRKTPQRCGVPRGSSAGREFFLPCARPWSQSSRDLGSSWFRAARFPRWDRLNLLARIFNASKRHRNQVPYYEAGIGRRHFDDYGVTGSPASPYHCSPPCLPSASTLFFAVTLIALLKCQLKRTCLWSNNPLFFSRRPTSCRSHCFSFQTGNFPVLSAGLMTSLGQDMTHTLISRSRR